MRIEPKTEQCFSSDGKDKIGQDIETRAAGKMVRKNTAVVEAPIMRTAPNFSRARIPLTAKFSDENQGARVKTNQENYAKRMTPEFKEGVKNIKEG